MRALVTIGVVALAAIAAQPIITIGVALIVSTGPVLPIVLVLAAGAFVASRGTEDKK